MGSHGGSSPPQVPKVDQAELDRQQSEAAGEQRKLASKRKGVGGTRLTDPIVDLSSGTNTNGASRSRVSLLGGGTYGS